MYYNIDIMYIISSLKSACNHNTILVLRGKILGYTAMTTDTVMRQRAYLFISSNSRASCSAYIHPVPYGEILASAALADA